MKELTKEELKVLSVSNAITGAKDFHKVTLTVKDVENNEEK